MQGSKKHLIQHVMLNGTPSKVASNELEDQR